MRNLFWLCPLFVLVAFTASPCGAQNDPPAKGNRKPAVKGDAAGKEKSDEAEWKRLIARKEEVVKEFESLMKQPRPTDAAARDKLVQRFQQLEGEFRGELQPAIMQLAPRMYEKDPTNPDAAEVVIARTMFRNGEFREAIGMADKVVKAGKATAPILTYKGIAQFNCDEFEAAKETLEAARKANPAAFSQLGAPQLAECEKYIGYWKDELALRAKEAEADDLPRVLLKTNRGEIELELFENEAPNTVANFISLVEAKKYDGVVFHRLEPGFVIQGGDPNTLDNDPTNDGQGGPGYAIACECYRDDARMHFLGSLSMAHAGRDTGGSQFFITHRPTPHLNHEKGKTESNHTVFGRVIRGLDVALSLKKGDRIETATVLRKRNHKYVPETLADKRRRDAKK